MNEDEDHADDDLGLGADETRPASRFTSRVKNTADSICLRQKSSINNGKSESNLKWLDDDVVKCFGVEDVMEGEGREVQFPEMRIRVKNMSCLTPNLWMQQMKSEGLARRTNVMRKEKRIPPRRMNESSLPDALTIGVSLYLMNVVITNIVNKIPRRDIPTGTSA